LLFLFRAQMFVVRVRAPPVSSGHRGEFTLLLFLFRAQMFVVRVRAPPVSSGHRGEFTLLLFFFRAQMFIVRVRARSSFCCSDSTSSSFWKTQPNNLYTTQCDSKPSERLCLHMVGTDDLRPVEIFPSRCFFSCACLSRGGRCVS
jgi:hypothetical protein